MSRILIFLLGLAWFSMPVAARADIACEGVGTPVPVKVTPVFETPRYEVHEGLDAIQQIASDRHHSIPQYHATALGITRYEPVLEFRVAVLFESYPNEAGCAHLQNVDVNVGYRDVKVYIAREIQPGGCGYNETIRHEEKHIAVNRQLLDEYVPLIEERFRSYVQFNSVFRADSSDAAKTILDDKLKAIMDEMSVRMDTENVRRQRDIDSPEEYDRLGHACNGELSRLVQHYNSPLR